MTGNSAALGSDLSKVDAHELGEPDYAAIPELSDAWFGRAAPHEGGKPRGRPKTNSPKQAVNLRLSQRVLKSFRSGGRGWQTRINAALEEWLDEKARRT